MKKQRNAAMLSVTFMLCLAMCAGLAQPVQVSAADDVSPADSVMAVPEWVPQSFTDTVQFVQNHGRTFVSDGFICIVTKSEESSYRREVRFSDCSAGYADDVVFHEKYTFEKPDESDTEATEAYEQYLNDLGLYEYVELGYTLEACFEVTVCAPSAPGRMELSIVTLNEYGEESDCTDLSFEISEDGIEETDIFSWLPDCTTEYRTYVKEYGDVSVHDGYVVFCGHPCYDGGYIWSNTQTGTGRMKSVMDYSITQELVGPLPPGGAPDELLVYEPLISGTVAMTWGQRQYWMNETSLMDSGFFRIDADGSVMKIDASEMEYPLYGDCNNDTAVSIMDALVLQKWSIGLSELPSYVNADINSDSKVNVFDLTALKEQLMGSQE